MKIEIYGIPEAAMRCPGCIQALSLLDSLGAPYSFYPVLVPGSASYVYDRPLIVTLANRAGFPSLSIHYPVIFVDDVLTSFKDLKQKLISSGYDEDKIED